MGKFKTLTIFTAGYVLGTNTRHKHDEQIKEHAPMATTETRNAPKHAPTRIEANIPRHRAEPDRAFNDLSKLIDVKKQTNRCWGRTKQRVVNSAFVAADDARLAMARAQIAPPRQ